MRVHLFHKLSRFQSINKATREYSDRRAYPIDGDTSPPPPPPFTFTTRTLRPL